MRPCLPLLLVSLVLPSGPALTAADRSPSPAPTVAERLLVRGLEERRAYDILGSLLKAAPSRMSGSPGAAAAVEWGRKTMEELGLETRLEAVTVKAWRRGTAEARILKSPKGGAAVPLAAAGLGNSVGTPAAGITARVVEVNSFDELDALGEKVKGKIVFFNRPMNRTYLNPFRAYGEAGDQRYAGAGRAAVHGAVAVLVRSLTDRLDPHPRTGMMAYPETGERIPALAVSTLDADLLSLRLKEEPDLKVFYRTDCSPLPDAPSHNVIGQITGTEKPEEVILLGAHLDAWDLSPGAHDDGGGCAQVLEALRLIKALDLKPKRTIRGVLFMCEEFGGQGGRQYAQAEARRGEKHLAAIESDAGVEMPLGFGIRADEAVVQAFQKDLPLVETFGMFFIRRGYGGVDIDPLRESGTVTIGLATDAQRYFVYQHGALDTLDKVDERQIELGAAAMAALACALAEEGLPAVP
jgi:carboxypeptidase Q